MNSTQETEVGIGAEVPEKEMGKGRGKVETWLVACSCWATLCRFG